MNNSLMSPEVKFMLQHAQKNFIDLDGDSECSSEPLESSVESIKPENDHISIKDSLNPVTKAPVLFKAQTKRFGTAPEDIVNNLGLYLKKEIQNKENKKEKAAIRIQKWIRPILV